MKKREMTAPVIFKAIPIDKNITALILVTLNLHKSRPWRLSVRSLELHPSGVFQTVASARRRPCIAPHAHAASQILSVSRCRRINLPGKFLWPGTNLWTGTNLRKRPWVIGPAICEVARATPDQFAWIYGRTLHLCCNVSGGCRYRLLGLLYNDYG